MAVLLFFGNRQVLFLNMIMKTHFLWTLVACATGVPVSSVSFAQQIQINELKTVAESSGYQATATHAQVAEMCKQLSTSKRIHLASMGKSHEHRDMPLLVVSKNGTVQKPADCETEKLVVFVMANIHAGEVCGKEALLMLARELAIGDQHLLDDLIILLAPIYNPDGNERFAKDNRPGQLGPAMGMGQRHNGQDLDLNRDNIKHESPEGRALAKLITDWKPDVCIDTHTTNGSLHRYTITYDGPRHPATPGDLVEYTRDTYLPAVGKKLQTTGYDSFFYGNFNQPHDRWNTYPDYPRYCTHYFGMRGTIGVLSEAYSYATYKDRVLGTRDFVRSCLQTAAGDKSKIKTLLADALLADKNATEFPIQSIPVPLGTFDVLGYVEELKNGKRVKTDKDKVYPCEYFGVSRPQKIVSRPFAYAISHEYEQVIDVIASHGITVNELDKNTNVKCESYAITSLEVAEREFQGHRMVEVTGTEKISGSRMLAKGTVIIKTNQPMLGGLIVNMLEPEASDGLCAWNFFDKDLLSDGTAIMGAKFPVLRVMDKIVD